MVKISRVSSDTSSRPGAVRVTVKSHCTVRSRSRTGDGVQFSDTSIHTPPATDLESGRVRNAAEQPRIGSRLSSATASCGAIHPPA